MLLLKNSSPQRTELLPLTFCHPLVCCLCWEALPVPLDPLPTLAEERSGEPSAAGLPWLHGQLGFARLLQHGERTGTSWRGRRGGKGPTKSPCGAPHMLPPAMATSSSSGQRRARLRRGDAAGSPSSLWHPQKKMQEGWGRFLCPQGAGCKI